MPGLVGWWIIQMGGIQQAGVKNTSVPRDEIWQICAVSVGV